MRYFSRAGGWGLTDQSFSFYVYLMVLGRLWSFWLHRSLVSLSFVHPINK